MKLSPLLSLIPLSFLVLNCSKDDEGGSSSGPAVTVPSVSLVAGDNFKNTAKDESEVASKFEKSADSFKSTSMGQSSSSTAPRRSETSSLLSSAAVQDYLRPEPRIQSSPLKLSKPISLEAGSGCGANLDFLNAVYAKSGEGLRAVAQGVTSFKDELPEGVTKGESTDEFAVTYTMDLSKLQSSSSTSPTSDPMPIPTEDSDFPVQGNTPSITPPPQSQQREIPVTGIAKLGVGASSDTAVVSLGATISSLDPQMPASFNGGFAAAVNDTKKLLKVNSDLTASISGKDESGSPQNFAASMNGLLEIQAGTKPSLHLKTSVSGTGVLSSSGVEPAKENHSYVADILVSKVDPRNVTVVYSVTGDGKTDGGTLKFASDSYGRCVIEANESAPNVTVE